MKNGGGRDRQIERTPSITSVMFIIDRLWTGMIMDGIMVGIMDGIMFGIMDGIMDGTMDGIMDGIMDGHATITLSCHLSIHPPPFPLSRPPLLHLLELGLHRLCNRNAELEATNQSKAAYVTRPPPLTIVHTCIVPTMHVCSSFHVSQASPTCSNSASTAASTSSADAAAAPAGAAAAARAALRTAFLRVRKSSR